MDRPARLGVALVTAAALVTGSAAVCTNPGQPACGDREPCRTRSDRERRRGRPCSDRCGRHRQPRTCGAGAPRIRLSADRERDSPDLDGGRVPDDRRRDRPDIAGRDRGRRDPGGKAAGDARLRILPRRVPCHPRRECGPRARRRVAVHRRAIAAPGSCRRVEATGAAERRAVHARSGRSTHRARRFLRPEGRPGRSDQLRRAVHSAGHLPPLRLRARKS